MHHIIAVFSKQKVPALVTFVAQAREKYTQNLDAYIRLILRRPLSRVLVRLITLCPSAHPSTANLSRYQQDYFQGLEQLLRTTPPTEVSLHSAYTKSALRRTLSDLRAKDLRKAVDALYKRVDKHFGDASVTNPSAEHVIVLKAVWTACENEMQRLTSVWRGLIEKCYPVRPCSSSLVAYSR
jgi:exocyst complex component 1